MANEFREDDELTPLPTHICAAFKEYPLPTASTEFDARFWSDLDARQHRYGGFAGFWRRLIEVEIEGIAVWRLGASTCGGALFCALGFALLSWSASPNLAPAATSHVAVMPETPLSAPRVARGLWQDLTHPPALHRLPSSRHQILSPQEEVS